MKTGKGIPKATHPEKIRTVTCRHWKRGHCELGVQCNFLHGDDGKSFRGTSCAPIIGSDFPQMPSTNSPFTLNALSPPYHPLERTGAPRNTHCFRSTNANNSNVTAPTTPALNLDYNSLPVEYDGNSKSGPSYEYDYFTPSKIIPESGGPIHEYTNKPPISDMSDDMALARAYMARGDYRWRLLADFMTPMQVQQQPMQYHQNNVPNNWGAINSSNSIGPLASSSLSPMVFSTNVNNFDSCMRLSCSTGSAESVGSTYQELDPLSGQRILRTNYQAHLEDVNQDMRNQTQSPQAKYSSSAHRRSRPSVGAIGEFSLIKDGVTASTV